MMAADLDECERFNSEWQDFVRVLERDDRDVDGKLLKRGSKVLCHPSEPETFREDNPGIARSFSGWTERGPPPHGSESGFRLFNVVARHSEPSGSVPIGKECVHRRDR